MMTIRPFDKSERDYEACVGVFNAVWPDILETVEEWKYWDSMRDPKFLFQRMVGEVDGEIVGMASYGEAPWSHVPGKYFIYVLVPPDKQRQGFGGTFYDHVTGELSKRELAPIIYTSDTREDKPDYVRFLTKRGYVPTMRLAASRLYLDEFDRAAFADYETRCEDLGLCVRTAAELEKLDPDWKRKLYELEWELFRDVPSPDPVTKRTFEHFEKKLKGPSFLGEAWFVAVDGDDYVGLASLWKSLGSRTKLWTGLTGVVRRHRRKGIATALKLRAITYAKAKGTNYLETDNEENNPMYDINMRLGFRPIPAWVIYRKALTEEPVADSGA
jgi:mycothiol synthase